MDPFIKHLGKRRPSLAVWAREFAEDATNPEQMRIRIEQEQKAIRAELDRMEKKPHKNPEQQLLLDAMAHQFQREHRQLARLRQALKQWLQKEE